jgi:hypothetical protein
MKLTLTGSPTSQCGQVRPPTPRMRLPTMIEVPSLSPNNDCNRSTGTGCVNPPTGASFYPLYSTAGTGPGCMWHLGGPYIPGTTDAFGGSSTAEFGPLLNLAYPSTTGVIYRYNDFRNVLSSNPC